MIEKIRKNKFAIILASILLIVGIIFVFRNSQLLKTTDQDELIPTITPTPVETIKTGKDPLNATYIIEGQKVTLEDGSYEEQIPNSSAVSSTKNFNQPIFGDLNMISTEPEDATFILEQSSGGSGTFYYVVASISTENGYIGTNGILLGDRIAPQTQDILEDGIILVNYADRAEGDSMADSPSVGVSKYFKVEGTELIEVEPPGN
jgi:hypothetical protein